jgi:hypothetical protein
MKHFQAVQLHLDFRIFMDLRLFDISGQEGDLPRTQQCRVFPSDTVEGIILEDSFVRRMVGILETADADLFTLLFSSLLFSYQIITVSN